jgi:hypothetical protein
MANSVLDDIRVAFKELCKEQSSFASIPFNENIFQDEVCLTLKGFGTYKVYFLNSDKSHIINVTSPISGVWGF